MENVETLTIKEYLEKGIFLDILGKTFQHPNYPANMKILSLSQNIKTKDFYADAIESDLANLGRLTQDNLNLSSGWIPEYYELIEGVNAVHVNPFTLYTSSI